MPPVHKDARQEFERRFLLRELPPISPETRLQRLADRYIEGTSLRLRRVTDNLGPVELGAARFKLTQKLAGDAKGALQGLITTIYLTESEYCLLAALPAKLLTKTRYSVPPFGVDVFEGELSGLMMAEAEFASEQEAAALELPAFEHHEVTSDRRFTGGSLAVVQRHELAEWLAGFGIDLDRQ